MAFDFKGDKQEPKPINTTNSNNEHSSSLNSLPRPGRGLSSKGFKNIPTIRDNSDRADDISAKNFLDLNNRQRYNSNLPKTPIRTKIGRQPSNIQIPWRMVLLLITITTIIILCIIFREAITSFLVQVLTWTLIVLIIIAIIKWLIFPKRR